MQQLFQLLFQYRLFLMFLLLEAICGWLIVRNNPYQSAAFHHTSSTLTGDVLTFSNSTKEFLELTTTNQQLAAENARLRFELEQVRLQTLPIRTDTLTQRDSMRDSLHIELPPFQFASDTVVPQYVFRTAKVINNSVRRFKNYLTINRGTDDGIRPGMGVASSQGVVGRVKASSKHFSTVTSVLHTDMTVSAQIQGENAFGSISWDGTDPQRVQLNYIPRHIQIEVGDTIVTTGYSTLFPPYMAIGTIQDVNIDDNQTFYDIDVTLFNDLQTVTYVYVIENLLQEEQDSLEQVSMQ
ncbi:rod shape-determining protein MreC [Catalinimonas alkaloidigena]|uniref:Cell shape-determining protein MreC n=1 Tax=Catalinimonas alkaloidigena TaxID=1075417 RepID=A0A1G9MZ80_9BACT|nr:rod shape-determining protein MreC [Catalinimonas alkaloidigena]SDL79590.1 rod shape-determining protein MreC [Catalinimonas alkaloidigena]